MSRGAPARSVNSFVRTLCGLREDGGLFSGPAENYDAPRDLTCPVWRPIQQHQSLRKRRKNRVTLESSPSALNAVNSFVGFPQRKTSSLNRTRTRDTLVNTERITGVSLRQRGGWRLRRRLRRSEHACNCVLNEAESPAAGAILLWTCHRVHRSRTVPDIEAGLDPEFRRLLRIAYGCRLCAAWNRSTSAHSAHGGR